MIVEYKFELDQKVATDFGDGLISLLAYDDSGIKYYVELASCGKWIKETNLVAI